MDSISPNEHGFAIIEDEDSPQLTFSNVGNLRNEVSPFYEEGSVFRFDSQGLVIDPYYGNAYTPGASLPRSFYGRTNDLPEYSGDALAELGFLRVPFRRIPRILLHHRSELDRFLGSIRSADPSLRLLFRGQRREYYLPRKAETRELLYGDPNALEPSLLSSASRVGVSLEDIGPEWTTVMQFFLRSTLEDLSDAKWEQPVLQKVQEDFQQLMTSYVFWPFSLAMAQHYGLPSAGLDVTDDLGVALFFAMNDFEQDREYVGERIVKRRDKTGDPSVLYILANWERFMINFREMRPFGFPHTRPDAQSAFFLHTAWGLASNVVARSIFVSIYLDPEGTWDPMPSAAELFPRPADDPFGSYIMRYWSVGSPMFRKFIQRLYWASEA